MKTYLPDDLQCECGEFLEKVDSGTYKGEAWSEWECPKCGERYTNEPDWDSMSGGVDDY